MKDSDYHFGQGHMCAGCDLSGVRHVGCPVLEKGIGRNRIRNGENGINSSFGHGAGGSGGLGVVAEAAVTAIGLADSEQDTGKAAG